MKINIIGRKINVRDSFKEVVEKKLAKLDKYFKDDASAYVTMSMEKNAERLGVSDRVSFVEWDIKKGFPEFMGNSDVIVSNPPYIPKSDILELDKKVKDFEITDVEMEKTTTLKIVRNYK